jgi:hypothetical protein
LATSRHHVATAPNVTHRSALAAVAFDNLIDCNEANNGSVWAHH